MFTVTEFIRVFCSYGDESPDVSQCSMESNSSELFLFDSSGVVQVSTFDTSHFSHKKLSENVKNIVLISQKKTWVQDDFL